MFCRNCGKEIQEEWTCCPNCGEKIHREEKPENGAAENVPVNGTMTEDVFHSGTVIGSVPESHTVEGVSGSDTAAGEGAGDREIPKEQKTDFTLGKTPISGRLLIKILSLIAIACFFCPLYMTSCAGREIVALDGPMLTFGFEYMGEKIDGTLISGLFAVLPAICFICAFARKKDSVQTLNYKSYAIAACSVALCGLIANITDLLQSAMTEGESLLEIEPCTALQVMETVSLITAVIGGYLAFLTEPRKKGAGTITVAAKCVGKVLGLGMILLLIIMMPYRDKLRPSTVRDDYVQEYEQEIEDAVTEVDLSDYDMKDFIGESREAMEELGFEDGVYDGTTVEYDENDKVNQIYIGQGKGSAPSFYGVSLGMEKQEASELLADWFPTLVDPSASDMEDEGLIRLDEETGEEVYCECEEGEVSSIRYCVLSEEELLEIQEENRKKEYIFPDSDKEYLSEDEVRSIPVENLAVGRNEIFARHGYIFKDEGLKAHFEATSWYEGTVPSDQFNSDAVFNDFEKKNVELIKKVENEVNGTGNTEAFIGISGTYQCESSPEAGVIDVYVIDNHSINIAIGTHAQPALLGGTGGGMPGSIVNSNTAVVDWGAGCVFTLTWSDAGQFTITHTGSTGWDDIDEMTNYMEYVEPDYYGVS